MSSSANLNDDTPVVLTVPGLGGSGPSHWQTLWEEARLDTKRVELGMWHTPHRNAWVTKL
ncbi:alpha/beta hydrolase, partial [Acinetobacter baumannii]